MSQNLGSHPTLSHNATLRRPSSPSPLTRDVIYRCPLRNSVIINNMHFCCLALITFEVFHLLYLESYTHRWPWRKSRTFLYKENIQIIIAMEAYKFFLYIHRRLYFEKYIGLLTKNFSIFLAKLSVKNYNGIRNC